jgi:hypothetical protein
MVSLSAQGRCLWFIAGVIYGVGLYVARVVVGCCSGN